MLKYGARRADGSGAWASVEPSQWSTILSTDGEEIGVFSSDNINTPYIAGQFHLHWNPSFPPTPIVGLKGSASAACIQVRR